MSTIALRGGIKLENPLELALEFLEAYPRSEDRAPTAPASFDERDL
jgi:hypothetical protein